MNPDKKYILLAVSGETPQIITETFFKLKETGYDIQEIHVITTVRGKNNLMGLLSDNPDENVFLKMCREYDWEPLTVKEQNIHMFSDQKGGFLEDIRTDEEERCAADFIFKTTRDLMELPCGEDDGEGYAIVASIAGGRKTMSYLMGSTMSILGRDDDELTHVLVDPRYERLDRSSPKFFYPTRESQLLLNADREEIDARDAKIDLSFIPFIKLGHILKDSKKKLLIGNSAATAYSDAVSAINYELSVNPDDIQLWADYRKLNLSVRNTRTGEHFDIHLDALEMAFYRMLLDNLKNPGSVTKPSKDSTVQELFRYWLRLYSFTPLPRESEIARTLVSRINYVIAKIRERKCLSNDEDGKTDPKTAFFDIYGNVVFFWKEYVYALNEEHGFNSCGMGQDCNINADYNDGVTPKKDNLLNYIGNETAFKKAHMNNWKKIQDDKVNSKIKQSGCPDAIQELLMIKRRTIPGTSIKTYSIALKWDQVAMPGYDPLPFAELDVPDELLAL